MNTCGASSQFVLFGRGCSRSPKFPDGKRRSFSSSGKYHLAFKDNAIFNFVPKAASASPSSPAQYPEQLLGAKPKDKRKKIAGIDQDELQDPALLADPDSCFCEFKGVNIHHKICDAESLAQNLSEESSSSHFPDSPKRLGFPMILLHGFGASVFSWNRVMKRLAQVTGSKILAFDRPAFGLTSRVEPIFHSKPSNEVSRPLNPYSIMFSVLATLYFVDFLSADKVILVGHSAGSLVAVEAYFEAPERVAAMILVAPAIVAPLMIQNFVKDSQRGRSNQKQKERSDPNPFTRLSSILLKLTNTFRQYIMHMLKGMGEMINFLYKKALSTVLRSAIGVMLVRMIINKFGIPAVRNAWYDSNQVTDDVLEGYTKPLRLKGWDRALVEYTIAMLSDSSSEPRAPLSERLSEISCPVLIVTGDRDRLVPARNSRRLSQVIPGSCLEIIKNCGHLPQEEKVQEFVMVVENFLQRTIDASDKQCMPAVT